MSTASSAAAVQSPMSSSPVEEKRDNGSPPPPPAATMPLLGYAAKEEPSSTISRYTRINLYLRFLLFVLIEAGFIALAAVCLVKPVPLNIRPKLRDSEVKGGFTVIFILWQSLAIIAGGYILADAFSREWSVQLAELVPGTTDRVSTVTSGFLDRILYFFTKRASGTFRLAFLASLSFTLLTQLAPGTISAATTVIDVPLIVKVGNLISQVTDADVFQEFIAAAARANLIVRLEQLEHSPFGLKLPPNQLIALPAVDLGELNHGTLEYDSDVVEFHHDCHWEAPAFVNGSAGPSVIASGQVWSTSLVFGGGRGASSISPLSLTTNEIMESVNTSAYLFIGGNRTLPNPRVSPPEPFAVDLGNVPTAFVPSGVGITAASEIFVGPLASVLVCDPQLNISGGHVRISKDGTVNVIPSGRPPIGNFASSAANLIFTTALQTALFAVEPLEINNFVNNVAAVMFMANSSVDWNSARNIPPLDLATINKNVDTFMLSAAKAFLDGYRKSGTAVTARFDLVTIPAIGQQGRLALMTSKGLFITVVVVVGITIGLLYALCYCTLTQKRYPFNLHSVFTVLQKESLGDDPDATGGTPCMISVQWD